MRPALRPVIGLALVLCGVAAVVGGSHLFEPKEIIPWRTDMGAAQLESRRDHKPIFAYFTADWCPACQQMARTTWTSKEVEAALRDYVPLRIDVDEHRDLARTYGANPIPAFVVLNSDGQPLRPMLSDALGAAAMVAWLHQEPLTK